jgi:hypothetical protein
MSAKHILLSRQEFEALSASPVPLAQLNIPEADKEALRNEARQLRKTEDRRVGVGAPPGDGHKLVARIDCVMTRRDGVDWPLCHFQYLWLLDDQPIPPGYFLA